jgi:hypothetical protein
MYFRFVAQSSRSKSIILVVTKVSSRPDADVRKWLFLTYSSLSAVHSIYLCASTLRTVIVDPTSAISENSH